MKLIVKPHKKESNEKDKKMCLLRNGVHLQQRFAEVLFRALCRGGKGSAQEETTGLFEGCPASYRHRQPGVSHTFSKAAILMGCSRQYVYKLVNEGKLPASRISSRMAFIRKADIEKMLAGNPYHRVLPGAPTNKPCKTSSSLSSRKVNNRIPEIGMRSLEPLEYISGEDDNLQGKEVLALCFSQEEQHTYLQDCWQELL